MKKTLITLLACMLLLGSSITVFADCVTHIAKDSNISSNWEFNGTIKSYTGSSHRYPVIINNGVVTEWGTCTEIVYIDRYILRCRNCPKIVDYKDVTRIEHSVAH